MGVIRGAVLATLLVLAPTLARAQPAPAAPTAAPAAAPPAAPPPAPPGAAPAPAPAQPPPGYAYPPGYYYPPPYAPRPTAPPAELPYDETKPIPSGYHLDERVRRGPLIAGAIVLGVPYVIGLNVGAAASFRNHSYWLAIPLAGPFLTLATRDKACDKENKTTNDSLNCLGDIWVTMLLVLDGMMQTTGGILVGIGVGAKKQVLVRDTAAKVHYGPLPVGTGYGFGAWGSF
jgi:hypothetical protein